MIIGINATFKLHGGAKTLLFEFIKYIRLLRPDYKIIIYTRKESLVELSKIDPTGIRLIAIRGVSGSNIVRILWEQLILPFTALKLKNDVLFCPGNMSPILNTIKKKVQWIGTVGPFCKDVYKDVSLEIKIKFYVNKVLILLSGFTSDLVLHESQYSMELFVEKYRLNKNKQFLIQAGKDDYFLPKKNNSFDFKYSNSIIVVSHLYRYKNIESLIYAYSSFIKEGADSKLYIIGSIIDAKYYQYLIKIVEKLELGNMVIFSGLLNREDLRYVYSSCKLFVFPSFCESSAYTLIEAMSCGAPILASNRTAIPSTCSEAAIYFDPNDTLQLSTLINQMMSSEYDIHARRKASLLRASNLPNYKEATKIFLNILENKKK